MVCVCAIGERASQSKRIKVWWVFFRVWACVVKVLWNLCVCEWVCTLSLFLKSIPWNEMAANTLFTLVFLRLLVETFFGIVGSVFRFSKLFVLLYVVDFFQCLARENDLFCCGEKLSDFSLQNTAVEKIGLLLFIISFCCS